MTPKPSQFLLLLQKARTLEKEIVTHSRAFMCLQTLTGFSNILSFLNNEAPRNFKGSSQPNLCISLEKHFSRVGMNFFQSSRIWSCTFSAPLHYCKAAPDSEYQTAQSVRIPNEPQELPVSESIPPPPSKSLEIHTLFSLVPMFLPIYQTETSITPKDESNSRI